MRLSVDEKIRKLETAPAWLTVRLPVDGKQDRQEEVPLERLFDSAVESHQGTEWFYSNVYDLADGVTPLRWWEEKRD